MLKSLRGFNVAAYRPSETGPQFRVLSSSEKFMRPEDLPETGSMRRRYPSFVLILNGGFRSDVANTRKTAFMEERRSLAYGSRLDCNGIGAQGRR